MKPSMRMLMATNMTRKGEDTEMRYRGGDDMDMRYRRGGYNMNYGHSDGGMENRFREGRGRERYNDGRYAPMRGDMEPDHEPEAGYHEGPYGRFRDRRGREHYNNGRFAPRSQNDEYEGNVLIIPPIFDRGTGYRYGDNGDRMIGFSGGEVQNNYRMDATHHSRDEMEHRTSTKKPGYSSSDVQPLTREKAQKWVKMMKNADGSTGEHWTYDQTTQVMKQRNIDCEPAEFYAVMNMLWSDYGKVAEKFGVSNVEYWAELSKAFLMDKDAAEDKLALYYECIVKK